MGYYVSLEDSDFLIPLARGADALAAAAPIHQHVLFDSDPSDLEEVFEELAWKLCRVVEGWRLDGMAEPVEHGWEQPLFEAVAPCVTEGSWIIGKGDDGERFEWYFSRARCYSEDSSQIELGSVRCSIAAAQLAPAMRRVRRKLAKLVAKLDDPETLTATFQALGWKTARTDEGGLALVRKPIDEGVLGKRDVKLLRVVAPYVTHGSYIEAANANGDSWRYVFDDGSCRRLYDP